MNATRTITRPTVATLPSGVSLVNAPTGSTNVGVYLIVRAGSRDEVPKTAGLAHFLEHMFFKGTPRRPTSIEISREFDSLGALCNAYTDTEEVAYYCEAPATAVGQLADIVTDMLSHPLFAPDEVERERNVVLQELANRLLSPEGWIADRLANVAFGGDQPMSWSPAGLVPVVEAVSAQELVAYHRSFYAPESMALVISGGVTLREDEAEAMLRDIPKANPKPRQPAEWGMGEPYIAKVRPVSADEEQQIVMTFAFPGVSARDPDRITLQVMQNALGGGMSSRLFNRVREREGLCYYIGAGNEFYDDAGLFQISTATRPKDAVRTTQLSMTEFRKMAAEPLPSDELSICKESIVGNLLRGTETARGSAAWHARRWRVGLPMVTPLDIAESVRAVTAEDVMRVSGRLVAGIPDVRLAFVAPTDMGTDLLDVARN